MRSTLRSGTSLLWPLVCLLVGLGAVNSGVEATESIATTSPALFSGIPEFGESLAVAGGAHREYLGIRARVDFAEGSQTLAGAYLERPTVQSGTAELSAPSRFQGWTAGSVWVGTLIGRTPVESSSDLGREGVEGGLLATFVSELHNRAAKEMRVSGVLVVEERYPLGAGVVAQANEMLGSVPYPRLDLNLEYEWLRVDVPEDWVMEPGCGEFISLPKECRPPGYGPFTTRWRTTCALEANPWCKALAWGVVWAPSQVFRTDVEWDETLLGQPLACPEDLLAEIGWRCDLTRIPEETRSTGEASEPEPTPHS